MKHFIIALVIILVLCVITLRIEYFKDKKVKKVLDRLSDNTNDGFVSSGDNATKLPPCRCGSNHGKPVYKDPMTFNAIPRVTPFAQYDVADPVHEMYEVIKEDIDPEIIVIDRDGERYMCDVIGDCDLDKFSLDHIRLAPSTRSHRPVKSNEEW